MDLILESLLNPQKDQCSSFADTVESALSSEFSELSGALQTPNVHQLPSPSANKHEKSKSDAINSERLLDPSYVAQLLKATRSEESRSETEEASGWFSQALRTQDDPSEHDSDVDVGDDESDAVDDY